MNQSLQLKLIFFLFVFVGFASNGQTTLTHNSCDIVETDIHSCTSALIFWSRTFTLQDFQISSDEEFIITSGQLGLSETTWRPTAQFRIYAIDDNFPNSFSETNLIGESQEVELPWSISNPEVITINFNTPVVVPAGTERILVEVKKGIVGDSSALAFIAGSTEDNGLSWQRGCVVNATPVNGFVTATDMGYPNANFYINVTGTTNDVTQPFTLNYSKDCSQTLTEFSLNNVGNINSVTWDFGDPASGANNTSTLLSPSHDFTTSGQYSITATISQVGGGTYTINESISVAVPPTAHPINDLRACENTLNSGFSSSFDTSSIEAQVVNGQAGVVVSYYDEDGNNLGNSLPNPFTNTQINSQEITVRVSDIGDLCCYTETTFNLIVDPLPEIGSIDDIIICDNIGDGYEAFDLSSIPVDLIDGQPNLTVELFDSSNNLIPTTDYSDFVNLVVNQDAVKAVLTNSVTGCSSETTINLLFNDIPAIGQLDILYGCDDNNDGISEYFDTSNIENLALNNQTGMSLRYFNSNGDELPSPLPNPFTNTEPFNQNITVRLTNNNTNCYNETILHLQTANQPSINTPENLYACDQGNGYSEFDTSTIEQQIIGTQAGLTIQYFDSNNNELPSPLPLLFQNTEPFSQTIYIRVEDASNPTCFSETSFDLIVNALPQVNLEEEYFICDLEASISLQVDPNFNSYEWYYQDGTLVSSTNNVEISSEGNYTLIVTEIENGIICENSFSFDLMRSESAEIQHINYGDLGDNFIEIIASGDGDFEYSIDGVNYQSSNYFGEIQGGVYTVFVRDKDGCGEDSREVVLIDYPRFFTPNNDGYNDTWQIKGIDRFPNSKISIFDRYGKLLRKLSSNDVGWNGFYHGKEMVSNGYWFTVDLGNGRSFSGYFTLKR